MDVASIVGAIGAITAAVFGFLSWRATKTRVRLQVNPGTAVAGHESDGAGGFREIRGEVVFVDITNRSAHEVKISSVGARATAERERAFVFGRPYPLHLELPIAIPARDSRLVWVPRRNLEETDLSQPLRFEVTTTAGDTFRTSALQVDEQPVLESHS